METKIFNRIKMNWFVILVFVISVFIRTMLAGFLKHAATYLDEWMYLGQTRGMINGSGISSIYGLPYPAYRWLYSLILVPACMINNIKIRFYAIAFTNSLVMNLSIFPIYLTAKRILKKNSHTILLVIITAAMPYLNMTISMMADVLFYCLASYILYFNFRILEWRKLSKRQRIYYPLLWVIFIIFGFLTKYTAVLFLVTMGLTILMLCIDYGIKKRKMLLFLVVASVCFMIIGYPLITENGILKIYHTLYVYAMGWQDHLLWKISGHYFFHLMLAFGIFPYLITIFSWKRYSQIERCYFSILTALLLMVVSVTVSTVYNFYWSGMPENWALLRYFMFLAPPFVIIFISACEKMSESGLSKNIWITNAVIAFLIAIAAAFLYQGPAEGSVTDHGLLFWTLGLKYAHYLTVFAILAFVIISLIILKQKPKIYLYYFVSIWLGLQLYNNVVSYGLYKATYETPETDDILVVSEFIRIHPEDTFLIIDNFSIEPRYEGDQPMRRADTYLDFPNVKRTSFELLNRYFREENTDEMDLRSVQIPSYYADYELSDVDYVLISSSCAALPGDDYEDIKIGNSYWYEVYENKDPLVLKLIPSMSYSIPGTYTFSVDEPYLHSNYLEGVSTEVNDYALYGPFCNLSPGNYTFTISYSYEGEKTGEVVGYADLNGTLEDLKDSKVPVYADETSVSFDLYVEDTCTNFEIRLYAEKSGLCPIAVTMQHTEN